MKKTKEEQAYLQSKIAPIFGIVKQNNTYKIVMGNYLVSLKEFECIKDAEDYIASRPWDLIYTTILITIEYAEKTKKSAEMVKEIPADSKED